MVDKKRRVVEVGYCISPERLTYYIKYIAQIRRSIAVMININTEYSVVEHNAVLFVFFGEYKSDLIYWRALLI